MNLLFTSFAEGIVLHEAPYVAIGFMSQPQPNQFRCVWLYSNRQERHTMATFMNNACLDDKTIEGQIGHYDASFTRRRYMNPQMKQMRVGMTKLSDYMESIGN